MKLSLVQKVALDKALSKIKGTDIEKLLKEYNIICPQSHLVLLTRPAAAHTAAAGPLSAEKTKPACRITAGWFRWCRKERRKRREERKDWLAYEYEYIGQSCQNYERIPKDL